MTSWIKRGKPNTTKNEAVICAIALHEERYIDEWIQYHLKLGFYHIFIYDNSDTYVLRNRKSDRVSVIHYPGKTKQLEVYNLFILNYKHKFKWGAFIDIDEFIVLKKHNHIMELLNSYQDCNALVLNWLMFGTNHETEYHEMPVTKRFQKCSNNVDPLVKSICQLSYINFFDNPHFPHLLDNKAVYDTNRTIVYPYENVNGPSDIALIHHYYTKSEQECKIKFNRIRPDIPEKRSGLDLDKIHEIFNDVVNDDAWKYFIS